MPDNREHEIAKGITYRWYHDKQIVVFTISEFAKGALNHWISANNVIMRNWPRNRPQLSMIYAPRPLLTVSLFIEKRATDVGRAFSSVKGREALVAPANSTQAVLRNTVERLKVSQPTLDRRLFTEYDEGLSWLEERISHPALTTSGSGLPSRQLHRRVLIVDDDFNLLRIFTKFLTKYGFDVYQASTLAEAGDFMRGRRFDIMLVDIELSGEYGTELMQAQAERLKQDRTHVIAISADAKYRTICEEMGAMFIHKPIQPSELVELLRSLPAQG